MARRLVILNNLISCSFVETKDTGWCHTCKRSQVANDNAEESGILVLQREIGLSGATQSINDELDGNRR